MKKILLTQGKVALVDNDMFDYLNQWKWYFGADGYAVRYSKITKGRRYKIRMHRLINNTPNGLLTDHIDGNTLNNQKENLRSCTMQQNSMNRKPNKLNKSGYSGIRWNKARERWYVSIGINRKIIHLGCFREIEDAIKARNKAENKIFKEFSRLNDHFGLTKNYVK